MNESLINVLSTILNGLAALSPSKSNKRKIGKTLARLCINLDDLCRDGREILKNLEEIRTSRGVDTNYLVRLLSIQAHRIQSIKKIIKNSKISTILKIKLPRFEDLKVYVEVKGGRIALLNETKIERSRNFRFMRKVPFDDVKMYRLYDRWVKIIPSSRDAIAEAKRQLSEINKINKEIRGILVSSFDIDEII